MRVSIPGVPGVYYDTDTGTTAIGVALTAAGRRAPTPHRYALQALPYLWSFEVDLHEVPNDHPIQYLHPEGARSLGDRSPERGLRDAGAELEGVLRFVWSVNREVESATERLLGRSPEAEGVVIDIQEGSVIADGDELETDRFDLEGSGGETDRFDLEASDDDIDATGSGASEDDAESEGFDTGGEL